ncbi:hypothetical protein M422DRAFT_244340 [Sphaerobolus stellatus SS14]|nr:hypothetical protein M422DRAFT_244340 [Sphaerobolus stellatus SS14]
MRRLIKSNEAYGEAFQHATHSLASYCAVLQLSKFYGCEATFEVQKARDAMAYEGLCRKCFATTGIACLLLDDLMDNVTELCYGYEWHDRLTSGKARRIVGLALWRRFRDLATSPFCDSAKGRLPGLARPKAEGSPAQGTASAW